MIDNSIQFPKIHKANIKLGRKLRLAKAQVQIDKEKFRDKKKGFMLRIARWFSN